MINELGLREPKLQRSEGTYAFIICPTRELCVQVVEASKAVVKSFIHVVIGAIMVLFEH